MTMLLSKSSAYLYKARIVLFGISLVVLLYGFLFMFSTGTDARELKELYLAKGIGSTSNEMLYEVEYDSSGNFYITGYMGNVAVDFDPDHTVAGDTPTPPSSSNNAFIAKYNSSGVLQWVKLAGNIGTAVEVDSSGNVYFAGYFSETFDFDPDNVVAGDTLSSASAFRSDYFLVKYNSSGVLQWVKGIGNGTNSMNTDNISVDSSGNIYLGGGVSGGNPVDYDEDNVVAGDTVSGTTTWAGFHVKYNSSGVLQFVKIIGSNDGQSGVESITSDNSGNSYVTGDFVGTVDFDRDNIITGDTHTVLGSSSFADAFIAKYNSTGVLQWIKQIGTTSINSNEEGTDLVLDGSGNIYATGEIQGSNADFDMDNVIAGDTHSTAGNQDIYTAKYNASGVLQWVNVVGGISSDMGGNIDINDNDELVVGGNMTTTTVDFDENNEIPGDTLTRVGSSDGVIFSYDSVDGSFVWGKVVGGTGTDLYSPDVKVDNNGNIYMAESYYSTSIDVEPDDVIAGDTFTNTGNHDVVIALYSSYSITSIDNLPGTLSVTDLATGADATIPNRDLATAGRNIRVKDAAGTLIANVLTDMSNDLDWGSVLAASDKTLGKAYVKDLATAPGASGSLDLYVPKKSSDDSVHLCPNAVNLTGITIACSSGYTITAGSTGSHSLSVVNVSGQDYWKITNFSDGGGIGIDAISTPPAPTTPEPEEDAEEIPPVNQGTNPVIQDEGDLEIVAQTEEYGDGEVEVCWETNKESKGKVEYGIYDSGNTEYTEEILIEEYGLSHCVTLTVLDEEDTEYQYKITAETEDGEIAEIERMITIYPVEESEEESVEVIDVESSPEEQDVVVRYETNYPSECIVEYGYVQTQLDKSYNDSIRSNNHTAYLSTADFPDGADLYGQIGCDVYVVEGDAPKQLVKSIFVARDSLKEQVVYEAESESNVPEEIGTGLAAVSLVLGGAMVAVYPNSIVYAFGWLRNKKKRRPWGLVYDRGENKPVAFAVVELYKGEKFIQKVVTDLEGRYMLPVDPGSYRVVAKQSGYEEAVEEITVTEPKSANMDIGLTKDGNSSMVYTLRKVLPKVNRVIFTVGFILALVLTVLYFNWINLVILVFYTIQIVTWYMMKSPRGTGFVYQSGTGKKVQGAIVKVHDAEDLGVEDSQMTNEEGRYGFILKDGEYRLSISGRGYEIDEEEARRNMKIERQGEEIYIVAQIVKGDFVDIAIPVKPSQKVAGFTQ